MAVAERLLNLRPDTDTRPDRALVYEAQRGREEAATVLYRRYYPRIYSFVSHLTYGRSNAEDLTQEVFARALKALGRFNGQYQFEHWLLRIAKNLCIDEARRNVHQPELTDPGELPELEAVSAPDYVWESVSRELVAAVVQRALNALPPRQRAILVMREMEGMSYADIAQVVATNPRGVEATLRRARARLRVEISRAESTEEARAACRRVVSLISANPQASQSEETAKHLARCAECRRKTRTGSPTRAFGFSPPLFGLGGLGSLLRRASSGASFRRLSGRARDTLAMAGIGTSAAMAAPLARMAEVAGGVLVATAVTLAPTLVPAQTAALPATTVSSAATLQPLQVASLPEVAVLMRTSSSAPVTAGPAMSLVPSTPSLVAPSGAGSVPAAPNGPTDLLSLGLGSGQNVVSNTLNSVSSVSNILADQLSQVAKLTNSTVTGLTSGLGQPVQGVTAPVTELTNDLTTTVGGTLQGVGNLLKGATSSTSAPSSK